MGPLAAESGIMLAVESSWLDSSGWESATARQAKADGGQGQQQRSERVRDCYYLEGLVGMAFFSGRTDVEGVSGVGGTGVDEHELVGVPPPRPRVHAEVRLEPAEALLGAAAVQTNRPRVKLGRTAWL